jgi:hypothetical protein
MSATVSESGAMPLTYEHAGVLHGMLEGFMVELRLDAGEELEAGLGATDGRRLVERIEDLASDLLLCARVWRALETQSFPLDQAAVDLLVTFENDAAEMASWAKDSPVAGDSTLASARLLVIRVLIEQAAGLVSEQQEPLLSARQQTCSPNGAWRRAELTG